MSGDGRKCYCQLLSRWSVTSLGLYKWRMSPCHALTIYLLQEIECLVTEGSVIVSSCLGGQLRVWDSINGECLHVML